MERATMQKKLRWYKQIYVWMRAIDIYAHLRNVHEEYIWDMA